MTEPKLETETLLETRESLGFYPMTVARYALLDAIASPFLTKNTELKMLNIIPSWFIMTEDAATLAKYNFGSLDALKEAAFAKADADTTLTGEAILDFTKKMMHHLYGASALLPVKPEDANTETKGKKARTAS